MNDNTMFRSINAQCCCFNLRKITRGVTQFFDRYLEPAGIRATQFTLLVELASSRAKTLTEMAEGLVMDRTTLTRNLRPLEKLGYITNTKVMDKRSKAYILTPEGHAALAQGVPLWEHAQKRIVQEVGHDRYVSILSELTVLKAAAISPKPASAKKKSTDETTV